MQAYHNLKVYNNGVERYTVNITRCCSVKRERHFDGVHKLMNAERSARRVRSMLYDIALCNEFKYFITLTFSSDDKIVKNRHDDSEVRLLYQKWRKDMRRRFPDMFYMTVLEYHKKGALHCHIVAGGVDPEQLGLVYWKDVPMQGKMIPCYIVGAWKYGYSTCTDIQSAEAVVQYVLKYITKGGADIRFFRKKRFFASHNIKRPEENKVSFDIAGDDFDAYKFVEFCDLPPEFFDYEHKYFAYANK